MKSPDISCIEDYLPPIILRVSSLEEAEKKIVGLYLNNFLRYGIMPPIPRELEDKFLIGSIRR